MSKPAVLILCTGNSCRSHMAEGILRAAAGDLLDVHSAGSNPSGYVHPMAITALKEIGIDISGHKSKHMNSLRIDGSPCAHLSFHHYVTRSHPSTLRFRPDRFVLQFLGLEKDEAVGGRGGEADVGRHDERIAAVSCVQQRPLVLLGHRLFKRRPRS